MTILNNWNCTEPVTSELTRYLDNPDRSCRDIFYMHAVRESRFTY